MATTARLIGQLVVFLDMAVFGYIVFIETPPKCFGRGQSVCSAAGLCYLQYTTICGIWNRRFV